MIKIKKLHPDAKLPSYAHANDAGMDFYASETITLQPNERAAIPTGIAMAIPSGFVGLLWDKSGMAVKHGLKSMAGVIDSGYNGEIKVVIYNLSSQPYTFEKGMKVAQMLIQPVHKKELVEVQSLEDTDRGEGGFGSTGL